LARAQDRRLVFENAAYKLHLELLVEERAKALNEALEDLNEIHGTGFETLAMALDLQDQGTSGHSRRVADMTRDIAKNLGIKNGELDQVEHGALLHDIGKLRIPDRILWKPAELNMEEWQIMRRHPRYGYEFVREIEFLDKEATDIILSHHEKFDGSGYPSGLKGEEISLGARIFSVVDAVDAMVHDRPYHRATTFPIACEEIIRHMGTHFDPDLVEPALTHMENYLEIPL
jgi:putative nucleotidyltransferase with HDIG domain